MHYTDSVTRSGMQNIPYKYTKNYMMSLEKVKILCSLGR